MTSKFSCHASDTPTICSWCVVGHVRARQSHLLRFQLAEIKVMLMLVDLLVAQDAMNAEHRPAGSRFS